MNKNVKLEVKRLYSKRVTEILDLITKIADEEKVNVYLVGGMVRDLLLKNPSIDLDITVEGKSGIKFAEKIAGILNKKINIYPEFYTALINIDNDLSMDIATCRKEIYSEPGALPSVEPSNIKDDLFRRDFTINALALSLNEWSFGEILDFYGGMKDLNDKNIKVLHDDSFKDDPTRILRAIRFIGRLQFQLDCNTEKLMNQAIKNDGLDNVSKDRIRRELKFFLKERNFLKQIDVFDKYIGLNFINSGLNKSSVSKRVLNNIKKYLDKYEKDVKKEYISIFKNEWIMKFMVLVKDLKLKEVRRISEEFNFSKEVSNKLDDYKNLQLMISKNNKKLKKANPGEVYSILNSFSIEAIFSIIAGLEDRIIIDKIWHFIAKDRFVKIQINGEDLKKMGVAPGPKFNVILQKVLYAKLNGKLHKKKDELDFVKKVI